MTRNSADLFLGNWQLQPALSAYELGLPPADGLYVISSDGDTYLFSIEWTTDGGQEFEVGFSGIPDGLHYPYENPQVADAISLTRVDDLTFGLGVIQGWFAHRSRTA